MTSGLFFKEMWFVGCSYIVGAVAQARVCNIIRVQDILGASTCTGK